MKNETKNIVKKSLDVIMTLLLLFLMAYQVTGEKLHEWIGIGETVLVIVHQILNRKWYSALFKGKYNLYRIVTTVFNILLIASFFITAFCGMAMSGYAVPFLYGMAPVFLVRRFHLSMSHWAFVLMGFHLGLHIPAMAAGFKLSDKTRMIFSVIFALIGGYGLHLFLSSGMTDYLFFKVSFAFLDYEKAKGLVLLENLLMLLFWAFVGTQTANLCRILPQKKTGNTPRKNNNPLMPVVLVLISIIVGLVCNSVIGKAGDDFSTASGWGSPQPLSEVQITEQSAQTAYSLESEQTGVIDIMRVDDGFILIPAGTFMMGSPETENWRIDDELQHEVTVSAFYIDPFETTQDEYERLTGTNPGTFSGEKLPIENISWLDAVNFANVKSMDAGLDPAYTVTESSVIWDRGANGYRLPTEAEWEYACRAGTLTPFNKEKSLSADEANFYGHYPYEIEENYFHNEVLEARPGTYRQKTVSVGSFEPNAWGLYDMHGNVNEWCWDYYGSYDTNSVNDPTGPESGTRHVYRGGGWNDFAKNMRSAYRAAGQENMNSFNLGVRLVRNADSSLSGTVTAGERIQQTAAAGKVLIAYFSWGGNTRGIAKEIQRQTGADLIEITPVNAYSTDYNTVLMEAQEDQHKQARPELSDHVQNMENYDVILLGYPNWWASIPMPIASFLEEYDFSGKTIIPFCSHGGGRFGQSITAIAKLAPDSVIGDGLSIHYSGGSSLPNDVSVWLEANGIN